MGYACAPRSRLAFLPANSSLQAQDSFRKLKRKKAYAGLANQQYEHHT